MPELATYVKFKVLEPEEVQEFLSKYRKIENKSEFEKLKKDVIEHFVFNLKNEVSDSLRMMSRKAAETCISALYARMHYAKSRSRFRWLGEYGICWRSGNRPILI